MTTKEKSISSAMEWLKQNKVDCYHDDGSVYVKVPIGSDETIDVQISSGEISYRAELYKV